MSSINMDFGGLALQIGKQFDVNGTDLKASLLLVARMMGNTPEDLVAFAGDPSFIGAEETDAQKIARLLGNG